MGRIGVSIVCNTFNHEKYIKDALDGFLIQKTNFEYEVLIHDDASTDHTADIIREYEKKYPEIIKPIYQVENQYSKGIRISKTYQYPRVKGKYIALCEGDDYWTDPHKLQKQFDLMEKHPELDICAHSSTVVEAGSGKVLSIVKPIEQTGVIPVKEVIRGGGEFVSTNSLMIRNECIKNEPSFRQVLGIDYTIQVHGSLRGGMLFVVDNMSVYRAHVHGSWIDRMRHNKKGRIDHCKTNIRMYQCMDRDTEGKYHWLIRRMQIKQIVKLIILSVGIKK